MAMEYNLKENIGDIKVCTAFKMLKVKVPIIFSRDVGFSATQGWTLLHLIGCSARVNVTEIFENGLNPSY